MFPSMRAVICKSYYPSGIIFCGMKVALPVTVSAGKFVGPQDLLGGDVASGAMFLSHHSTFVVVPKVVSAPKACHTNVAPATRLFEVQSRLCPSRPLNSTTTLNGRM